jgi:hypothetical protein
MDGYIMYRYMDWISSLSDIKSKSFSSYSSIGIGINKIYLVNSKSNERFILYNKFICI